MGTILVRKLLIWKQSAKTMFASLERPIMMERKVILKQQYHIGSHGQIMVEVKKEGSKLFCKETNSALTSSMPYLISDFNIQSVVQLLLWIYF